MALVSTVDMIRIVTMAVAVPVTVIVMVMVIMA